jgi:phosphocarrier protein
LDGKDDNMIQQDLEIINKLGLHARASAKFTQLAAKYKSDVWLTRNGRRINAKSIMGVMMLAAGKGAKVSLEADGVDEKECVEALIALINDKFGEGE